MAVLFDDSNSLFRSIDEGARAELRKILGETKVIAVVGCSRNPEKAAHQVPEYLKNHG